MHLLPFVPYNNIQSPPTILHLILRLVQQPAQLPLSITFLNNSLRSLLVLALALVLLAVELNCP